MESKSKQKQRNEEQETITSVTKPRDRKREREVKTDRRQTDRQTDRQMENEKSAALLVLSDSQSGREKTRMILDRKVSNPKETGVSQRANKRTEKKRKHKSDVNTDEKLFSDGSTSKGDWKSIHLAAETVFGTLVNERRSAGSTSSAPFSSL